MYQECGVSLCGNYPENFRSGLLVRLLKRNWVEIMKELLYLLVPLFAIIFYLLQDALGFEKAILPMIGFVGLLVFNGIYQWYRHKYRDSLFETLTRDSGLTYLQNEKCISLPFKKELEKELERICEANGPIEIQRAITDKKGLWIADVIFEVSIYRFFRSHGNSLQSIGVVIGYDIDSARWETFCKLNVSEKQFVKLPFSFIVARKPFPKTKLQELIKVIAV